MQFTRDNPRGRSRVLISVHPRGVNDGPFGQDQLEHENHSTSAAVGSALGFVIRWTLVGETRQASLILFSFLMLFRFLLSASVVVGALAPAAVEARSRCGLASHYGHGDGFAGQLMANGSPMNPQAMITAHPSLPIGTRLRVTSNGRSVMVRVADRGPWYGDRVLDLSYAAFSRLAHPGNGVAQVCYQVV